MTNSPEEIFKNKTKPKNPIKFKIELNAEQKDAIASLLIGKGIFAESDFMSETATKNG